MAPSRNGQGWSGWAGVCGGRVWVCVREQEGVCVGKVKRGPERWKEVEARTAFPQSRPQLPPAAAVGGFCGGAPCPDGINSGFP